METQHPYRVYKKLPCFHPGCTIPYPIDVDRLKAAHERHLQSISKRNALAGFIPKPKSEL